MRRAALTVAASLFAVLACQALAGLLEGRVGRLPAEIQKHRAQDQEHDADKLLRSHTFPPPRLDAHFGAAHSKLAASFVSPLPV